MQNWDAPYLIDIASIAVVLVLIIKINMLAFIKLPLQPIGRTILDSAPPVQIKFDQCMTTRHCCPCCSSVLLRHISQGHVYWRCSHCRAAMAVWSQV